MALKIPPGKGDLPGSDEDSDNGPLSCQNLSPALDRGSSIMTFRAAARNFASPNISATAGSGSDTCAPLVDGINTVLWRITPSPSDIRYQAAA